MTLVRAGHAVMRLALGSELGPVERFQSMIERLSGARLDIVEAEPDLHGVVYLGLAADFPWLGLTAEAGTLGAEGFLIRSVDGNLLLIADQALGVERVVTTFLYRLGHRQFFPGAVWEVVPALPTISGVWQERATPAYRTHRRLWYGFGMFSRTAADHADWLLHNRMEGPQPIQTSHSWVGIDAEADFAEHPEWFALVMREGELRRHPSKPCYSHPEVIDRMIAYARRRAGEGAASITLSPPDGLNYCECEICREVFQGGEPFEAHRTLFATRPDGVVVNITSETLFAAVNRVAEALSEDYPEVILGCLAYSAYSHPPSFNLHPSVYIQTTTGFRRTPLTLEAQMQAWGERAQRVGIYEYWSVYQWDWDNPNPGKLSPDMLRDTLRTFHRDFNVTAINSESSNNWGPRGLGYYLAANLLWDVDVEVDALIRDFYLLAFGPAAPAMQDYYVRWYGPAAQVMPTDSAPPAEDAGPAQFHERDLEAARLALTLSFADLDRAASQVADLSGYRERVDHLRMYAYYLYLRLRVWEAAAAGDEAALVGVIRDETVFGGRLTYTNMIHARPLTHMAFNRRFRTYMPLLETIPEAQTAGQGWRQTGEPPERPELDALWAVAWQNLQGL